jgi:hypothetical protein
MTANDMKYEFLLLYDKITNYAAPGYLDKEISTFLTKAQEQIVLKLYNPNRNVLQQGVEQTEQLSKYLLPLVSKPTDLLPVSNTIEYTNRRSLCNLPDDHLFTLSEGVIVKSSDVCYNDSLLRVKVKTNDELEINKNNPFKKPDNRTAWRLYQDAKEVVLYTDIKFMVDKYRITYLRRPNPIIVGSITVRGILGPLDSPLTDLSNQIIDEAVMIATGITSPELIQIKQLQNINNQ